MSENVPGSPSLIAPHVREILRLLGEDPTRDGLAKTPERVGESLTELVRGYREDPDLILGDAIFPVAYDEMVIVRDIELFSLCEHHLLPFFGRCHVAYIPRGRIVGLSKVARLVDVFARRLQVQERLTVEIAEALDRKLAPLGVAVAIEAQHLCMMMRGVEKAASRAVTSAMLGCFREEGQARSEFLALIGGG